MARRRQWALGLVGLLLTMFGLAATIGFLRAGAEFDAAPDCTRSLKLAASPRIGRTCSIVAGKISSKYKHRSNKTTDTHMVVSTDAGTIIDVVVENVFWSRVYDSATPGDPVVVETLHGRPAFIATSTGTLSGPADARFPLLIVWIFIPIGAAVLVLALRGRS